MDLLYMYILLGDGDTVINPVTVSKDLKHSLTGWTITALCMFYTW